MTTYKLPIPTRASKLRIHAFAEDAVKKLHYAIGGSINDVVTLLGGTIKHSDPFEDDLPESIRVERKGEFTILISSLTSSERDRFTIAHELGHYLLHFPMVLATDPKARMKATRWVDEQKEDQTRAEWEANWFAAGFLMPKADFMRRFDAQKIGVVASHFGVSEAAVKVRAKSLELIK